MGKIDKVGNDTVYRQDDGQITANLTNFEEKQVLGHGGSRKMKTITLLLVGIGVLYLAAVFFRLH